MRIRDCVFFLCLILTQTLCFASELSSEALDNADYISGKTTFQQRCSACHTLAENSANLVGPNLWHIFDQTIGKVTGFSYSAGMKESELIWTPDLMANFLQDPQKLFPDTRMFIPEPVPANFMTDLVAFVMFETDAADKPKIEKPQPSQLVNSELPLSDRFPSFWNHLMTNTTHYRLVTAEGELEFDAYFNTNGSVGTSLKGVQGFWHVNEKDMFCYALYGLPTLIEEFVECFPVAAMAIPRFARELWRSEPQQGVKLYGGILPGRP